MRTAREVTLPLHLDRAALKPLPAQVVAGLRGLLDAGVLRSGDTVPSSRSLAAQLGVSRGTVMAAYEQLLAEGWFVAEAGSATRVNPRLREVRPTASGVPVTPRVGAPPVAPSSGGRSNPPAPDAAATVDLRPGRPWQGDIVGPQWKAAWRRAADQPLDADVPVLGWPPLRTAIADHLRRMRALVRSPEQVVVTAGGREGLALVLRAAGLASIGVEEPGYLSLRRVPPLLGIPAVPLAADEQGLRTADLPANVTPDAVLVTPSHQYPLGGSLPIDRRQALLAWARAHGVLVIEDDYDSELRYTTQPLPTLTALDEVDGQVVLLGTFSKTLSPSLATGFVVVQPSMLASVVRVREAVGTPVSLVAQRALAHYMAGGALDAHTQRMRNLYRR
ncbi:MAG: PLP-dependent aminotransferase family protein, partial [Actinomycetes bacterium]